MNDAITIETDMFEHREVKPHFINPCCFGEDFAAWMKRELSPLVDDGFTFSEPIQEDYGWGLWAWHGKDPFWIGGKNASSGRGFSTGLGDPARERMVPGIPQHQVRTWSMSSTAILRQQ